MRFKRFGALGPSPQPNGFPSAKVEFEVELAAPGQPADNSTPGQSEAWLSIFKNSRDGEAISVPYHDVKVTEPHKLATMTRYYAAYRAGELPADELPDIRDVFPDDPIRLAEMGFIADERLSDEALLRQTCGQCHNDRADQTVSRARFNIDLSRMSAEAKQVAIQRLQLPPEHNLAMPPARLFGLSNTARARLIALLTAED